MCTHVHFGLYLPCTHLQFFLNVAALQFFLNVAALCVTSSFGQYEEIEDFKRNLHLQVVTVGTPTGFPLTADAGILPRPGRSLYPGRLLKLNVIPWGPIWHHFIIRMKPTSSGDRSVFVGVFIHKNEAVTLKTTNYFCIV